MAQDTNPNPQRTATVAANTTPLRVYRPTGFEAAAGGLSVVQEFRAIGVATQGNDNFRPEVVDSQGRMPVINEDAIYKDPERTIRQIESDVFTANTIKDSKLREQQIQIDTLNLISVAELSNTPNADGVGTEPQALQKEEIKILDESDVKKVSIGPLDTFARAAENLTGFQRSSRFRVKILTNPKSLNELSTNSRSDIQKAAEFLQRGLFCSSITTPAREFETTELGLFGYDETYPTGTEFTSITCTFMLPILSLESIDPLRDPFLRRILSLKPIDPLRRAQNPIYQYFVAWQNSIQDVSRDGSRTFKFPDTYRLTDGFVVETFSNYNAKEFSEDDLGQLTSVTRYYDVYPKTISPAELDWNATDEFLSLSVEFVYTHWDNETKSVS